MPHTLIIELHYLPCIQYLCKLKHAEEVFLEAHENFQKQTYRNRCYILGANNIECLNIPVNHPTKKNVRDITIDYSEHWHKKHIRAISSAYGKAPFYEHYAEYFFNILLKKYKYLFDLNMDLLNLCLRLTATNTKISLTNSFKKGYIDNIIDARNVIRSKGNTNVQVAGQQVVYQQVFGREFVPNLSVVDVLMNNGPESSGIINKSFIN